MKHHNRFRLVELHSNKIDLKRILKIIGYSVLIAAIIGENLFAQPTTAKKHQQDSIFAHQYLQNAHQYAQESAVESANLCAVEAADYFLQLKDWKSFYNCYRLLTVNALRFQHHSEAIKLFEEAARSIVSIEGEDAEQTYGLLHHLQSTVYYAQGNHPQTIQLGTKAISILEKIENAPHLERIYYNLAGAYHIGNIDFQKSIRYAQQALVIHLSKAETDSNRVAKTYLLLGKAYRGLRQYNQAIEAFKNSQTYRGGLDSQTAYLLSIVYLAQENCQQSLDFAQKAVSISAKEGEIDSDAYLRLASAYKCAKNYEQAHFYHQKALKTSKEIYGERHPDHVKNYVYLGDFYREQEKLEEALAHYQTVLNLLEPDFESQNKKDNPSISERYASIWSIEAISYKASIFEDKFEIEGKQEYLQWALNSYEWVLQNIEFRRRAYTDDESKHYLLDYIYDVYEGAIRTAFKLYELTRNKTYLQKTFQLIEASKASVLKEATHENTLQYSTTIPPKILQSWEEVKITLAQKEKEKYDLRNLLAMDSIAMKNLQSDLFKLNRKKEQLALKLAEYPDYTRLKYSHTPPKMAAVQATLSSQQALIEYFIGENQLYACLFTQDTSLIFQQTKPKNFEADIQDIRRVLTNWDLVADSTANTVQEYTNISLRLFAGLLQEPLQYLKSQKQLIIIPDGILGYLPFEVLLSEGPQNLFDFQNYPYLLREYSISYAYATALWMENEQKKEKGKSGKDNQTHTFGGFAPSYQTPLVSSQNRDSLYNDDESLVASNVRSSLGELIYTRQIVTNLAELLDGQKWLDEAATKENFQKTAADYGVLHLAMHGIIDDKNPLYSHLVFTETESNKDNRLTAAELYHMQLNAGLAVLSACNTGVGELKKGEGIMSLSRAFAFAGCPSMVMSLWSVPDEQTGILMEYFYKELKAGSTKDEALRQAKLQYLEEQDNRGAHPYSWAGFVVIGDAGSIDFERRWGFFTWCVLGLGLLLLIAGSVFYYRK